MRNVTDVMQGPPWLLRLVTPLVAGHIARELSAKHPGLGPREIGELIRAELAPGAQAEQLRFLDAVIARIPAPAEKLPVERPVSAWVLVAANLLPLAGVLFWDWNVMVLLLLFWMENVVIGLLNVLRMLCADPRDLALWAGKLFLVPFFCVHYGMFTAIHGSLLLAFFGDYASEGFSPVPAASQAVLDYGLGIGVAAIAASHLFSFLWNYLYRGEFRHASLSELMEQPYRRVVLLHLVILLGGFAVAALGSPLWALVPLVAVKVVLDVRSHLRERSRSA